MNIEPTTDVMIVTNDAGKKRYMNAKIRTVIRAIQSGNKIYMNACLDDYDAKMSIGWPAADEHILNQLEVEFSKLT